MKMFGECHAHILLNGYDYRKAVETQKNGPRDTLIRAHFEEYRKRGIRFVRDGGDHYGVSKPVSYTHLIDLAQYREMEVFTQFSSDLDEATTAQLKYGSCLMELLKQPLCSPLSLHQQDVYKRQCQSPGCGTQSADL